MGQIIQNQVIENDFIYSLQLLVLKIVLILFKIKLKIDEMSKMI